VLLSEDAPRAERLDRRWPVSRSHVAPRVLSEFGPANDSIVARDASEGSGELVAVTNMDGISHCRRVL